MSTIALIVAVFTGLIGFGCLVAGVLLLQDFPDSDADNKAIRPRLIAELLDLIFLFGAVTTAAAAERNWRRRQEARRFIYAGFGCLVLMLLALYLR